LFDSQAITLIPTQFTDALIGMQVSHVWRGYGSALFVEFGKLTPQKLKDGSKGYSSGEITLMIEWSWRIEKARSIVGGSWSNERKWSVIFKKLEGASVIAVNLFGSLPEIEISLSNGYRVLSFMTAKGQPIWCLLFGGDLQSTVSVKRGKLLVEPRETK
jgi:hypothetical protein